MKLFIASDVHGSLTATEKIISAMREEGADQLVLLGDVYYHGPRNPLPEGYAPMEVAKKLNDMKNLTVIRGNCDCEVDGMISDFPFLESALLFYNDKKIFLTHGHVYNENSVPAGCDVLIYGHFHTGFIKDKENVVLANPGSVSLPKNGTEKSYLTLNNGVLTLKKLDDGSVICQKNLY